MYTSLWKEIRVKPDYNIVSYLFREPGLCSIDMIIQIIHNRDFLGGHYNCPSNLPIWVGYFWMIKVGVSLMLPMYIISEDIQGCLSCGYGWGMLGWGEVGGDKNISWVRRVN